MKPTLCNVNDVEFIKLLSERVGDQQGREFVFFDWVSTDVPCEALVNQIQEMKRCQEQQIPVIVFDRHSCMTPDEVMFLHKRTKALLFEPAIISRPGFQFMPYWVQFREYKYSDFKDNRRFQTGYKGEKFTKDLEVNVLSVIKDEFVVGLDVKLSKDKYDILKSIICIDKLKYSDFDTMILTGDHDDYNRGILPDIAPLLQSGTVPLVHHKHKWFHSLFRHFMIFNHDDIRWSVKLYQNCGIGFLEDMQKNILEYMPEMEINNFIDNLLDKAERL